MAAMSTTLYLQELVTARLAPASADWLHRTLDEIRSGTDTQRFCARFSMAFRHIPAAALAPTATERARAAERLPGFDPARWTLRETARVLLLLNDAALSEADGAARLEEVFRYADEGELCALYRSLAHLPRPERFVWRAGEGCRSNMRTVFEATACDTPYLRHYFDELAWCQALLKALFVGAPLHRIHGLDERLSPDLARMALDYADERRSAGRGVAPELWLCLGTQGGERALASLRTEVRSDSPARRAAAAYALARAGHAEEATKLLGDDPHALVKAALDDVAQGRIDPGRFAALASAAE